MRRHRKGGDERYHRSNGGVLSFYIPPSAAIDAAMAKARVGEAYRHVTILGHQIFGGIEFTIEHDMHLFHRRSVTGDMIFDDAAQLISDPVQTQLPHK